MPSNIKLSRRKMAELIQKGVIRQEIDGSLKQVGDMQKTAPRLVKDNRNRSWKVHDFERDWEGYITAVLITET